MQTTGGTIIYGALRDLTVLRSGQGAAPEVLADALQQLNEIVDGLNTERLTVGAIERNEYDTTAGTNEYFLGDVGGDAPRPVRIEGAGYIASGSSEESPVDVLTSEQWRAGRAGVYNDNNQPTARFYVRPTPAAGDKVVLYTWRQIAAFDQVTAVTLAPGYAAALRAALADALAPSMLSHLKANNPLFTKIAEKARETKAAIKAANITPYYLAVDSALTAYSDRRAQFWQ